MTWEEKIKQIEKDYRHLLGDPESMGSNDLRLFGNSNCCRSTIKGAAYSYISAIKEGDITKLREVKDKFENQYKGLKLLYSTYSKYKGVKQIVKRGGIQENGIPTRCCGTIYSLEFTDGILVLILPEKFLLATTVSMIFLTMSRLIRDGEKRCLKHPRHTIV